MYRHVAHRIRTREGRPVVHENGFIQYPITPNAEIRLHVWPDTPLIRQSTSSPIHDHRFGFTSTVLFGTLDQMEYHPIRRERGAYAMARVRHGRLTVLPEEPGAYYTVELSNHLIVRVGESYEFAAKRFHESRPRGLTVTVMEKLHVVPGHEARVLCHRDEPPDNTFDRHAANPVDRLWDILDQVVDTGVLR